MVDVECLLLYDISNSFLLSLTSYSVSLYDSLNECTYSKLCWFMFICESVLYFLMDERNNDI